MAYEVGSIHGLGLQRGGGQANAESLRAVNVVRVGERAVRRPAGSYGDRHDALPPAKMLDQPKGVAGGLLQCRIPADCRDALDEQVGRVHRHHDRQGVVGEGIGVNYDSAHTPGPWCVVVRVQSYPTCRAS